MRHALAVCCALVYAAPVAAEPVLTLPATVQARPGRFVVIEAGGDGKLIRWVSLSPEADVLPYLERQALFVAAAPGEYRVLAYTAVGDTPSPPAFCVVRVAAPAPPVPPTPPVPPDTSLVSDLKAALEADTGEDKVSQVRLLIVLYRDAVRFSATPEILNTADLAARLKAAANALLPASALPGVRKRLSAETVRVLGDASTPLTPEVRARAADLFARLARALEEVAQ